MPGHGVSYLEAAAGSRRRWLDGALNVRSGEATDDALAELALRDRAAFAVLYDRYVSRVYRYCLRRLESPSEAEDATSAIFVKALERLDTYRGGSFPAWLFAIARTTVADRFRRQSPLGSHLLEAVHDPRRGPDEVATDALAVSSLLALLSGEQREVFELRLAGLTGAEIARAMNRSVPAIKMLQHRAMSRLRAAISEENE